MYFDLKKRALNVALTILIFLNAWNKVFFSHRPWFSSVICVNLEHLLRNHDVFLFC